MFRTTSILIIIIGFIYLTSINSKLVLFGDSLEYLIQTQSIVYDQQLKIDVEKRMEFWNKTNPYQHKLKFENKGFGGLYPDFNHDQRYYHSFTYSLLVSPIYFVLSHFSPKKQYYSFVIFNTLCLLLALFLIIYYSKTWLAYLIVASLIVSPLATYVHYPHPEIFQFSFIIIAFYLIKNKQLQFLSPIILGLAASQNIPLLLFFPLHFYFTYSYADKFILSFARHLLLYFIAGLIAVSSLLYFYYYFGTFSPIAYFGFASISNISLLRLKSLFFSPWAGAIFYFPFVILLFLLGLNKKNLAAYIIGLISIIAAALMSTATTNFLSIQAGCFRYVIWLLPIFIFLLCNPFYTVRYKTIPRLILILVLIISSYKISDYYENSNYLLLEHFVTPHKKKVAKVYAYTQFHDDPELLAEVINEKELRSPWDFNQIYVWQLTENKTMVLFSKRALLAKKKLKLAGLTECKSSPSNKLFTKKPPNLAYKKIKNFHKNNVFGHYILAYCE